MSTTINGNPKTLASSVNYLPYGGLTGLTYGNGLSLSQGYDNQYRISSVVTGSILNLTYGYDANGNITSILDTVNPPGGEIFENPGTYTYQLGTNKLTHMEGTPSIDYGYDANANITSETGWTYVYDLSNQLIRVLQNTTQVGEYTYNGAGQRIKKVTQTETRILHYDLRGHLIAETNQTGQMLVEYIYLGDELLAMIRPGELAFYFHNDHLGTPQILTDDSQIIAWKAVYTPFGEAVPSIQTVENPFRFPGQYYDQETGLHYNYFRYYNPQTGRYITPDPIGLEGGINLFGYLANNPIKLIDPLGLAVLNPDFYPISPGVQLALEIFNAYIGQDKNIVITGGDRPPACSRLDLMGESLHIQGIAADIYVEGQSHLQTANQALQSGLFGGIGWYEEGYRGPGGAGPHVQVDLRTWENARWGRSRQDRYRGYFPLYDQCRCK